MKQHTALQRVLDELLVAQTRFKAFHSAHEGVAVVEEEFLELREVVFDIKWDRPLSAMDKERMEQEARQTAAMAVRFMIDICEEP